MEGDSCSLQSTNNNPVQPPAFDFTGIIDQVMERTSENHEKAISALLQNLNI